MNLQQSFEEFEAKFKQKQFISPSAGFEPEESSAKEQSRRIAKALKDFWYFDRTYFPPDAHRQGYSKPGFLHKQLHRTSTLPGIHWHIAHRNLAKSAYGLKLVMWHLLRGQQIWGFFTEDLRKSRLLIDAISFTFKFNERIKQDFKPRFVIENKEQVVIQSDTTNRQMILLPFSPKRTPRGTTVAMERPDGILFDDVETTDSSMREEALEKRYSELVAAWKSLRAGGTMLGLGNNLDPKCLANKLLQEQEKGIRRDHVHVYPYPDWSLKKTGAVPYKGSVWKEAFPAKSEQEMRRMRAIVDDIEWSEAQCKPRKASGIIFPRELYQEYDYIPADATGPAYADPNLSLKGKGDSTAFGAVLFSPSEQAYYVYKPHCESYSDPNKLLSDFLGVYDNRVRMLGMDGNVTQQSMWTNFIRGWTRQKNRPYPPVRFCHYRVDDHITIAQTIYHEGKLLFPKGFAETAVGEEFLDSFHNFAGKAAGKRDDAPDFVICCLVLGFESKAYPARAGLLRHEDYHVHTFTNPFDY